MPPTQYKQFEQGTYPVTGLSWFSKGSDGKPIFKVVGRNGWMVAQYRTYIGQEEGPPGSVTPDDLMIFAYTFGCDVNKIPADRTQALIAIEEMVKANPNVNVPVYVGSKGWISNIPGMSLPTGEYLFERGDIVTRKNGQPVWYQGRDNWGDYIKVSLKLVMNADGTPTPFAGATNSQIWVMRKPLTILRALFTTSADAILGSSDQELEFMAQSLAAENERTYVKGTIRIKDGGTRPTIDPESLVAVSRESVVFRPAQSVPAQPATPAQPVPATPATPATPTTSVTASIPSPPVPEGKTLHETVLRQVVQFGMDSLASPGVQAPAAFNADGKLTVAGRKWCGNMLKPIAKQHGLTTSFSDMDTKTVQIYIAELGALFAPFLERLNGTEDTEDVEDLEDTSWD